MKTTTHYPDFEVVELTNEKAASRALPAPKHIRALRQAAGVLCGLTFKDAATTAALEAINRALRDEDAVSDSARESERIGWLACRRQVFSLTEETINKWITSEFERGRCFEAKGIAKAIGSFGPDECSELRTATTVKGGAV